MTPKHLREEIANALTHGVGALLSIAGLVVLVLFAAQDGGAMKVTSFSIFGAALVILYTASTCYHCAQSHRWKRIWRKVDHAAIYLLIAGTYTPFTLLNLQGGWGWTLFGLVWGFALIGIAFKAFYVGKFEILSTLAYLAMGWVIMIAIKPALSSIQPSGLLWLAAGGLAYTFGVIFYAMRRLPYNHAIWHVFVLAGSACHFVAVLRYALPAA